MLYQRIFHKRDFHLVCIHFELTKCVVNVKSNYTWYTWYQLFFFFSTDQLERKGGHWRTKSPYSEKKKKYLIRKFKSIRVYPHDPFVFWQLHLKKGHIVTSPKRLVSSLQENIVKTLLVAGIMNVDFIKVVLR